MKQVYIPKRFSGSSRALIDTMNVIIEEYQAQGFVLTVRQLYYQLVARDVIPNTLAEYKRVASVINDAKLAGEIDWDAIEDRTREFVRSPSWESGASILRSAAEGFHMDMWKGQDYRVFVIVEKEALVGVLEGVCRRFDVPLLAARGYPSGSVLREFAETDLIPALHHDQTSVLLHLGDHDPSGIDMSRDLTERLALFATGEPGNRMDMFKRIALNMPQIEELHPPENPAKVTDSRFEGYRRIHGESSWELDALSPVYLADLIEANVTPYIDDKKWNARSKEIEATKVRIRNLAKGFE